MDDRIKNRVPSANNGTQPVRNAATMPMDAATLVKQLGDTLQANGPWKPAAEPEEEATKQPFREMSPTMQGRILKAVNAIFVRRTDAPMAVRQLPSPVFDPATANTYGDGSLMPPAGQAGKNVPAPGQGKATPPGLTGGNSVFRYGENGDPANFQILDQGSTNGCGTTSLAMMLDFMAGGKKVFDREDVDRSIRHYDMFTSPGEAAAFARRRGAEATIHTDTSIADLHKMVDQGLPVQVLLDVNENHDGSGLHYEVVTGYGTGPDGKKYVELANPWGQREYMPEDTFMAHWSNLTGKGFPLGINRVAISMKPKGSPAKLLSNDEGAFFDSGATALRVARGLTQVTSGWARHDAANLFSGAFRLVFGGITAIPALLGHAGRKASEHLMSDGVKDLGHGFLGTLKGLAKIAGGALGWAVSTPIEAVGNVANRIVDFGADAIFSASRSIGKLFRHH
ncbi:MAG: hypothetical protein JWM80_6016 [Cyanobacteria bacterium RYN_339]|nr:hypothetical protein [Cyanobacteria bacterium RYN_339]